MALYADIRNFSAYNETRPPDETAAVLHTFISRATEIVERHGGLIQAVQGDAILAVWPVRPQESLDQLASQACDAALATLNDLPENGAVRYWLLASRAEAALGLGDEAQMASSLAEAAPYATEGFMLQTTTEQLRKLRGLLAASPLHSPPA